MSELTKEQARWLRSCVTNNVAIPKMHLLNLIEMGAMCQRLEKAAQALIDDVKRRHPGEELKCEFMRNLNATLNGSDEQ